MWIILLLSIGAVVLAGCSRVVFPGDGRLVIIEIDPAIDNCIVFPGKTVGEAVREGIRYWDQAGARLRTVDQLTTTEQAETPGARRLRFTGDACSDLSADVRFSGTAEITPADAAEFNYDSGEIYLHLRNWSPPTKSLWLGITACIAHEVGHAIGLDHVPERDAVMHSDPAPARADLSDADLREHARVWP